MDFLDLVKRNRSYRGFDESKPVSMETLEKLVKCARFTPSAVNLQPLKYYLSADEKTNAKIFPLTRWAGKLAHKITLPLPGHCPTAYIIICVDTDIQLNPASAATDIGIAAQTMLLQAVNMGLGGCMIGAFNKDEMAAVLELPSNLKPALTIALGVPDEEIVLEDAIGNIDYYRDENGTHRVPKRTLDELIIKR